MLLAENYFCKNHCVESVRIRSFSGQHFPAFGLNTEIYRVNLHIQSECGKIRTRIATNIGTIFVETSIIDVLQGPKYAFIPKDLITQNQSNFDQVLAIFFNCLKTGWKLEASFYMDI